MADGDLARSQLDGAVHQRAAFSRTGAQERIFSRLFRGLVYAQIWEDPAVDMQALALGPEDHVVCIASGGCNMMSYLTAGPASVSAVDLSPAHVALGRLKIAAAQGLPDHAAFYDIFGHANRPGNPALYDTYLAPMLDDQTRSWWEARMGLSGRRIDMFARGFYRFGVLGRFISGLHTVSRLFGVDYRPLLDAPDLQAQQAFFDSEIGPLFDRRIVRFLARRRSSLFGLGIPPAQFEKLARDGDGDIVPVLRERMRTLVCDFPVAENYFAWAAFNRGYRDDGTGPVPPYLEARHFGAIREGAARASVTNAPLTEHLAVLEPGSASAYSLLDAQDWMTDAQLTALWAEITRTAKPGARVIFRTGGATDILPGRVPAAILSRWTSDTDEGRALHALDRSAIYGGFHVYRLVA